MHKVVGSTHFRDLETRQNLDMSEILDKAYRQVATQPSEDEEKKSSGGNPQGLKQALQMLMSNNVAKLDSGEIIKGADVANEVELFVKIESSPDEL